jgi:hypothetical protein
MGIPNLAHPARPGQEWQSQCNLAISKIATPIGHHGLWSASSPHHVERDQQLPYCRATIGNVSGGWVSAGPLSGDNRHKRTFILRHGLEAKRKNYAQPKSFRVRPKLVLGRPIMRSIERTFSAVGADGSAPTAVAQPQRFAPRKRTYTSATFRRQPRLESGA